MKLRRLAIDRLPGIDAPFVLETEDDGIHVVHGPNGIGKSSICRAVEALLWLEHGPERRIDLSAEFDLGGERWRCERDGRHVAWRKNGTDSPAPPLPPAHLHHCFFLKLHDLIDPKTTTSDIAAEIHRQMSGGYDLSEVNKALFDTIRPRAGASASREYETATQEVAVAEGQQEDIQREAERLGELRSDLERAESDERRLPHVAVAKALVERTAKMAEAEAQIAALPAGLDRLPENARGLAEKNRKRLTDVEQQQHSDKEALAEAERGRDESDLAELLDQVQLASWRAQSEQLLHVEMEIGQSEADHRAEEEKLDVALAEANADTEQAVPDVAAHGELFDFLRRAQDHARKVSAIEERLRILSGIEPVEDDPETQEGASALRAWLRAPDLTAGPRIPKGLRWWWMIAAALFALGLGLALLVHSAFAASAGAGAAIACALVLWSSKPSGPDARTTEAARFRKLGLTAPAAWDVPAVEARLRDLEGRIAELRAARERARDRNVEVTALKAEKAVLDEAAAAIVAERRALKVRLGLEAIRDDADLLDVARALDRLRQARIDERGAAAKLAARREQHATLLDKLSDVLTRHGQFPAVDAASVKAGLQRLCERDQQLQTALTEKKRLDRAILGREAELAVLNDEIDTFYNDLSLERDDEPGLSALIDLRPRYVELCNIRRELKVAIGLDRPRLEAAGEAALGDLDEPTLNRLEVDLTASAANASSLRDQIAQIDAEIRHAREAHDMEDRIARRDAALAALERQFAAELFEQAGKLLLGDVEQEYEQNQKPRVLERATTLFSAFTRHNYTLAVRSNGGGDRLVAVETRSNDIRELAELSDGTRVQLLLAARLAHADEVERGATLPLFLDEALDQSDPVRYGEIVKSLGKIADGGGRQIFYFTNDPVDLQRIQAALAEDRHDPAHVIDLAEIRGRVERVASAQALHVEPLPPVPAPDGRTPEDYGVAIGVRPFDPRRGAGDQDLFHLVWDDLELLQELLTGGIRHVGHWRSLSESAFAEDLRKRFCAAAQIDAKAELLDAFCDHWARGRGRPIDRDAIVESDAVSDRFLEDVVAIAAELNGDGARLIEELQAKTDPRLKGFRASSVERFEQFLRGFGHLDDRNILSEGEIVALTMAMPAAARLPSGVPRACIARWWSGTHDRL